MRRAIFLFIALVILALSAVPGGATACGCGEFKGPVVAYGSSLYGVPWRIKAVHLGSSNDETRLLVEFIIGDADGGYGSDLPLLSHRALSSPHLAEGKLTNILRATSVGSPALALSNCR